MNPEVIAEYELVGCRADSAEFPVHVRICRPVQSVRMAPARSCSVVVHPLWAKPFEIYGDSSFQALCLGAKHAVQMLATFIEQEGELRYSDGSGFEPSAFGFSLLARDGASDEA